MNTLPVSLSCVSFSTDNLSHPQLRMHAAGDLREDRMPGVNCSRGWFAMSTAQRTEHIFRRHGLLGMGLEALTELCVRAESEEQYAAVIRSLPEILGSLLGCSVALEEFVQRSIQLSGHPVVSYCIGCSRFSLLILNAQSVCFVAIVAAMRAARVCVVRCHV